jgi:hypothetical protein
VITLKLWQRELGGFRFFFFLVFFFLVLPRLLNYLLFIRGLAAMYFVDYPASVIKVSESCFSWKKKERKREKKNGQHCYS